MIKGKPTSLPKEILDDLLTSSTAFIETGTGDGRAVELVANYIPQSQIFSCDILTDGLDAVSRTFPEVKLFLGRSTEFLSKLRCKQRRKLFWLDARRDGDVPLVEELEIIFKKHFTFQTFILVDDIETLLNGDSYQLPMLWKQISNAVRIQPVSLSFFPSAFGTPGTIMLIEHV